MDLRKQRIDDVVLRERFARAILTLSGEQGYHQVKIKDVISRAGGTRAVFYRLYGDKRACYLDAYAPAAAELSDSLLAACRREDSWRGGLRAALFGLAAFIAADRAFANGLLVQVWVAGGEALELHAGHLSRCAQAIDVARQVDGSCAPGIARDFVLNAIESAVTSDLASPQRIRFEEAIPDLLYIATSTYLGTEEAMRAHSAECSQ